MNRKSYGNFTQNRFISEIRNNYCQCDDIFNAVVSRKYLRNNEEEAKVKVITKHRCFFYEGLNDDFRLALLLIIPSWQTWRRKLTWWWPRRRRRCRRQCWCWGRPRTWRGRRPPGDPSRTAPSAPPSSRGTCPGSAARPPAATKCKNLYSIQANNDSITLLKGQWREMVSWPFPTNLRWWFRIYIFMFCFSRPIADLCLDFKQFDGTNRKIFT